jgi:peptidoglycan/LPS O-acetylase OafA/YrhL
MTLLVQRPPDAPVAEPERPTAAAAQPRRFRPDIEGLRAIAVVSVVLYHAHLGVGGGFVGVDVFFVISGYLITRQLTNSVGRHGLRVLPEFYARRMKRLLPAAAVVVVATVLAARVWGPPLQARSVAMDGLFTTFYSLNYRLAWLGTQYLHQGDSVSPLQHFWSLGVEEQFYVVWPLLIAVVLVLPRRIRTPFLACALTAIVAVSYRWSIIITAQSGPWAYFSLQTRAWELALGALVAVGAVQLARMPGWLAEPAAFAGLAAIVISCFAMSDATAYPGSLSMIPVAGAAIVLAAGVGRARRVERILGEALMQCLGRVSYSWYLWHWPMLILAPSVVGHPLGWAGRATIVWLSLVAAIASFFYVEDPARRLNFTTVPWLGLGTLLSGAVAASMLLVAAHPPTFVGHGAETHLATGKITPGADPNANNAFLTQVRAAVAASMDTTAAPSNLTPQPQKAPQDNPQPSKDGCHLDYLVVKQAACVYGDPAGTKTVVLFGDSHMEQWEPAFSAAGRSLHWKVVNWTKAACPAADIPVRATTLNRTYTECATWRQRTIERIAALKPDLVMVGESENSQGVQPITPEAWRDATLRTLETVKRTSGARVVFMGDNPVPHLDQTVPNCVAANLNNVQACGTDLAHAYTYPERHKTINPAITAAGYDVVDPKPWMCSDTGCPPVIGNYLVYRDQTHVSAAYATYLTPLLASVLTHG